MNPNISYFFLREDAEDNVYRNNRKTVHEFAA